MIRQMKADLFRIFKEKSLLFSIIILIIFSMTTAFLMNKSEVFLIISTLSMFLPLFFVTPVNTLWGEDYTYRTINPLLIRSKSRFYIYIYKFLMTILISIFMILVAYFIVVCLLYVCYSISSFSIIYKIFIHQFPLYLCIISLCVFIFNYVDKIYQAYLIFFVLVMFFDNLMTYLVSNFLETTLFNDFFIFNQLRLITGEGKILTMSVFISLSFLMLYFLMGYILFLGREFK